MSFTYYRIWRSWPNVGFFSIIFGVIGQIAEIEHKRCNCIDCVNRYHYSSEHKKIDTIQKDKIKFYVDLRDPINPYVKNNILRFTKDIKPDDNNNLTNEIYDKYYKLSDMKDKKEITEYQCQVQQSKLASENMWDNYFEPMSDLQYDKIEEKAEKKELSIIASHGWFVYFHRQDTEVIRNIIKKYIILKPFITTIIDVFYNKHLNLSSVLGVHYRGGDKKWECKLFPVDVYISDAKQLMKKYGFTKIFLCTDTVKAAVDFKKEFGDNVVFTDSYKMDATFKDVITESPFTTTTVTPFKQGLDVLVDTMLLSKCDGLLRCYTSNIPDYATLVKETKYKVIKLAGDVEYKN